MKKKITVQEVIAEGREGEMSLIVMMKMYLMKSSIKKL